MKKWMQKLASIHALNEAAIKNVDARSILENWNNMRMNPDANFAGMGEPILPNGSLNPDGSMTGIDNRGMMGSGDIPSSTLPLAMNIAANTIALELVPTIPMTSALTVLPYSSGVYAGGATNRGLGVGDYSDANVGLVKAVLDYAAIAAQAGVSAYEAKQAFAAYVKDHEIVLDGAKIGATITFTGMASFYDKAPIFEIVYEPSAYRGAFHKASNTTPTFANIFTGGANGGPVYAEIATEGFEVNGVAIDSVTIKNFDTVKTYEDFVPFYTGVSKYGTDGKFANGTTDDPSNFNYDLASLNPYLRSEGEVTPGNKVSIMMSSTKVDAKTIKIVGEITREQFQDMTSYGYDPYGFLDAILTNECTQRINFDIIKALHQLGRQHASACGFNGRIVMGKNLNENTLTLQKQIVSKFNLASSIISTRSRVSPANWVVVGAGIGAAIMDMPSFIASPVTTATAAGSNSVYNIGTLGSLKVYVDPYLDYDSTTCLVGAVGTNESPGLKFMPYILADQVTYPSEGMGGQNVVSMISRYAIAPAGMHPETLYMSFDIKLHQSDDDADIKSVFPYLG